MAFASGSSAEINVTPLIDVLLVLLIIFMVVGPALPHGLTSSVPQSQERVAVVSPELPVTVRVAAGVGGGVPVYRVDRGSGGEVVSFAELRPVLQRIFAGRLEGDGRTVFLKGERSLSFAGVAAVAGEARAAGAGQVALMGEGR